MSASSVGSMAYRDLAEPVHFFETEGKGQLEVAEVGTYDADSEDRKCVDTSCLWIQAWCGLKGTGCDEVCLSREQVAKLAASLTRWVETGILSGAGTDAD